MPYRLPAGAIRLPGRQTVPEGGFPLNDINQPFEVAGVVVRRGQLRHLSDATKGNLGLVWEDPVPQPAPPPRPTFQTAQDAIMAMRDWIKRAEAVIDNGISPGEQMSYTAKEKEALAWQADNTVLTPILSAELAVTQPAGIDVNLADLVSKVLDKAGDLSPILGEIAGLRRSTEAALLAEEAKPDFDPFALQAILSGAITQAISLASNRGIALEP